MKTGSWIVIGLIVLALLLGVLALQFRIKVPPAPTPIPPTEAVPP
jgi:hypothetical protein